MFSFYVIKISSRTIKLSCLVLLFIIAVAPTTSRAQDQPKTFIKTEHFDGDPNWQSFNNHIVPKHIPTVTQDFGYSQTTFAGDKKGEIGGRVQRSTTPASYAASLADKTLHDKLSASGTFAFTATSGSSGLFFGFFNFRQTPGQGRPTNSLGMDFDCEGHGARLAIRLISGSNKFCGTFITPFIPGVYRPTPIKNDGTRYHWSLNYDPGANSGNGQIQFTIKSNSPNPEGGELKVSSTLFGGN